MPDHDRDAMATVRGMLLGVLLGAVVWVLIVLIVLALWPMLRIAGG